MAGGPAPAPEPACDAGVCAAQQNFTTIINDRASYNFCLVPNGGADAVFFAGVAVLVVCVASPKWDALIVLFAGALYQALVYSYPSTFGHVTNASSLWLGMRPADIFVFVFLPPFLVDLAVRIDYFMLKKMLVGVLYMAFVMVIISTMLMIPFCLWALDLASNGWTGADVALFGATIASTDAASVAAILSAGGAPEMLSVILEGESLFNDASSLTLFEIFTEVVEGHHQVSLGEQIGEIVSKTLLAAVYGICIGLAMGIFNRIIFLWLQHRNMHPKAEVAFTVAGCYLSFYITQVWCKGSGCIAAVAYGLYGSSTLLWGMSNKARYTAIFSQFWDVFSFIINGLIFFYVGASCVNFTVRCDNCIMGLGAQWSAMHRAGDNLYEHGISELLKDTLYRLPLIYLFSFALRAVFLFIGFKLFAVMKLTDAIGSREIAFITLGGLRGSLSLVLASAVASQGSEQASDTQQRVRAEMSIYIAGYVILTLLVNAPLCGPVMTLLKLDHSTEEQLAMRKHVKELFRHYSSQSLGELQSQQDEDDMLQGVDWMMVEEQINVNEKLDVALPERQPRLNLLGWLKYFRRMPSAARTISMAKTSVAEDDDRAREKREARVKEKNIDRDLKRTTVGMAKLGQSSDLASTSFMGNGQSVSSSEPSMLILGAQGLDPAPSSNAEFSRKPSRVQSAPATHVQPRGGVLTPLLSFFSRGRHSAGSGPSPAASLPGALPSPAALTRAPTLNRTMGASMRRGAAAAAAAAAAVVPGAGAMGISRPSMAARPAMVRSRSIALQRQTSMRPAGAAPIPPPAPPAPPPSAPSPPVAPAEGLEGYGGDAAIMDAVTAATRVLLPADANGGQADAHLPLPPSPAAGPDAAPATPTSEHGGSARSSNHEEETQFRTKHANPVLVIRAKGSKSQQPLAMSGQGETSELAQLSSAGVRFVQRQSRVDGGQFVEAIHSGKAVDPRTTGAGAFSKGLSSASRPLTTTSRPLTTASRPLTTASRPLGRGSVGNQTRQGGGFSSVAIAALTAAAPGDGAAPGRPLFESPPGHEFDGLRAPGQWQASPGPGRGTERSLATRSTAVLSAGRWGDGGDDTLGRASFGVGGGARTARPLGRGSVGQIYSPTHVPPRGPPPTGFAFESPPGHEGDGLAAHALGEGPGGRHSLATRSTGFPGFGPILETQDAKMQRPLGRRSVGQGAMSMPAFGGRDRARPFFESPPGHEADGMSPVGHLSPRAQGTSTYDNPLHTSSPPHPGNGFSRGNGAGSSRGGTSADRPLASRSVGLAGAFKNSSAARPLATHSIGGHLALGTVNEQEQYEPGHPRDEEQGGAGPQRGASKRVSGGTPQQAKGGFAKLLGGISSRLGLKPSSSSPNLEAAATEGSRAAAGSPTDTDSSTAAAAVAVAVTPGGVLLQVKGDDAAGSGGGAPALVSPFVGGADVESAVALAVGRKVLASDSGGGDDDGYDGSGKVEDGIVKEGEDEAVDEEGLEEEKAERVRQQEYAIHSMLPECRMRLLTGLKQYYREKYEASVLGAQAYKTLTFCCDSAHHHPHQQMELWKLVQQEVGHSFLTQEVKAFYSLKSLESRWKARHKNILYHGLVSAVLGPWIWLLSLHLNNVMMVSLETAVELWISLTDSMQTQWLSYTGSVGEMVLEEVQEAAQKAWDFIIDRRVEIPETFQAIQTHRATVQLLSQQRAFVHQMSSGGLFEQRESERMLDVVELRLQRVRRKGPQWRAQTVTQILANTALLRNVSPKVIEWIKRNSTIRMYKQGELIWQRRTDAAAAAADADGGPLPSTAPDEDLPGVFVVISGVAKIIFQMEHGDVPMHLGSGSLCGLLSTVLQAEAPGMTMTALYAEGHALGEGPVVLHMPVKLVNIIRHFSREERLVTYQQLELQMLRTAANNVVDLLHEQVTSHLGAFIRGAMQQIVCTGKRGSSLLVRRQRLRTLLHEHDVDLDNGFDWMSELLSMRSAAAHALLEHGEEAHGPDGLRSHAAAAVSMRVEGLSPEAWHEQMFKAIAAANTTVYEQIRSAVKESCAVVLGPGKPILQHCTMVLIQGSLSAMVANDTDDSGGGGGGGFGRHSRRSSGASGHDGNHGGAPLPSEAIRRAHTIISRNDDHVAPSVMVWTPDFFGEEVVKQSPVRIQAGEKGATLMVLGDITPLLRLQTAP